MAYHGQQGVDTAIVRIFNTYGPRMRPNDGRAVSNFMRQALAGEPLTVFGDGPADAELLLRGRPHPRHRPPRRERRAPAGQHRQPRRAHAARARRAREADHRRVERDRLRGAPGRRSDAAEARHHARPAAARLGAGGLARGRALAPAPRAGPRADQRRRASEREPLLVRALRREPAERTPVWFMRQAGRSLPEYRALREKHGFFEIAGTPELCAEVTLQPVRRHGVDAAVLFADIMSPVLGMGVDVELVEGVGPVIEERIDSAAAVERLQRRRARRSGLRRSSRRCGSCAASSSRERALVGFCGGPFTVAGYLVEGKPSRDFVRTKALMYREPAVWHALMEPLDRAVRPYVAAQGAAGADAIQLFDSWVGVLSVDRLPGVRRSVLGSRACGRRRADDPFRHRRDDAAARRDGVARAATRSASTGGSRSTTPGRSSARSARFRGTSSPPRCSARGSVSSGRRTTSCAARGARAGHVFNLGHGVLPQTDPDVLTRLTALVQNNAWVA